MPFPCPGCQSSVPRSPESWLLRCPTCGARIRSHQAIGSEAARAYDVELLGRPETRQRIEIPWSDEQQRRLEAWLLWATMITLGLIVLLFLLARGLGS
jgi:hypothetical protein